MSQPADLVTLAEAKTFIKKSGTADDLTVGTLITQASQWLEMMTGRLLAERAFTTLRFTGPTGAKLYPPAWPINPVATVTIKLDEIAQTVWRTETDGDLNSKDVVVASDDPWDERRGLRNHLFRSGGWTSVLGSSLASLGGSNLAGQYRILLTYSGGYKLVPVSGDGSVAVPQDLKQACLYLVQKLWRDLDQQRTGLSVIQMPGGGSVTVPDPTIPREVPMLMGPYRRLEFAGV